MAEYKITQEDVRRADIWAIEHRDHVQRLLSTVQGKDGIEPTGSDARHPELWKAIHWQWLTTMNFDDSFFGIE